MLLGIAEGIPGLPRPNAVAKFLLRAVAELDGCDEDPPRPFGVEILRAAHRLLCEEADLRRFVGGAARVALAEVCIDRVTALYTAPAGILLAAVKKRGRLADKAHRHRMAIPWQRLFGMPLRASRSFPRTLGTPP